MSNIIDLIIQLFSFDLIFSYEIEKYNVARESREILPSVGKVRISFNRRF